MQRKTFSIFDAFSPTTEIVRFDALVSETHNRSMEITVNPVEGGNLITDFVIKNPVTLSITGFVTNNPVVKTSMTPDEINAYQRGLISSGQQALAERNTEDRRKIVYDALNNIYKKKQVVNVLTNLDMYKNLIMEDLSITLNESTGTGMPIEISFREIMIAYARAEEIARVLDDEKDTGVQNQTKKDMGKTSTEKYSFTSAFLKNIGL